MKDIDNEHGYLISVISLDTVSNLSKLLMCNNFNFIIFAQALKGLLCKFWKQVIWFSDISLKTTKDKFYMVSLSIKQFVA